LIKGPAHDSPRVVAAARAVACAGALSENCEGDGEGYGCGNPAGEAAMRAELAGFVEAASTQRRIYAKPLFCM
jgi:hypothetical protein